MNEQNQEVLDRGDDVEDKLPPSTIDDSKELTEEEKAAEALAEGTKDAEDDEPARGKDGKFVKKEREVPDHVPKARFDDAVGKERAAREAAEARAAELAARLKQEEKSADVEKMEADIEKLEQQHTKLLLDGESEKASQVMKQIRHAERQIAKMESDEKAGVAVNQAVEQVRMEAAIAKLESEYTVFNPDSGDFDQDLIDMVLDKQARLIQVDRMSPSKALLTAAAAIMKKFTPVESAPENKGLAAAKGSDRKAEQVAKNLDTAKRQPASMKAGKDSDKAGEDIPTVAGMTMTEFNALPESTKSKLRGDTL